MFHIILAALAATAFAGDWQELKTGDEVQACLIQKTETLAKPFFGKWIESPQFDVRGNFNAYWTDSQGGNGEVKLETGAPPAAIYCQIASRKNENGELVSGPVCVPNLDNGVAYLDFTRNVKVGDGNPSRMNESVPVIVIKDRRLFCTL